MRRTLAALAIIVALAAAGCGTPRATVSGKVSYKGRSVTSGTVVVLNPDHTASKGEIQPDGSYAVAGVALGRIKIGVLSANPAKGPAASKTKAAGWFPLPRRLGNPGTSGLECEVTALRFPYDLNLK